MGNYIFPTPSANNITSPYGYRNCPFHGREFHSGIDIGISYGNVVATRAGTVTRASSFGGYGNCIDISHGGGLSSRYAHLSKFKVKKGDKVSAGQIIAISGSTGNSTGPHLHFEIRENGKTVSPLSRVKSSDTKGNFSGAVGSSIGGTTKSTTKEVSKVVVVSTTGKMGTHDSSLKSQATYQKEGIEILIQYDNKIFIPVVKDDITLSLEKNNTPGKLEFSVFKDSILKLKEGCAVRFKYNNTPVFFGYIFKISSSESGFYSITAYDQLRYFNNKDILSYKKKTYSQVVKMLAKKYKLGIGSITNTKYIIQKRIEDGSLFDIVNNAAKLTKKNTGKSYVLYDNFGRLTLKSTISMKTNVLIDADSTMSFTRSSSIDGETYNRIKLYRDNDNGVRKAYVRNRTAKQKEWGILQYVAKTENTNKTAIIKETKSIMDMYCKPQKTLSISCLGSLKIKGGSGIMIKVAGVTGYMTVQKVTHKFSSDNHTMDLTLVGGGYTV